MVEAAGIEPASEMNLPIAPTCFSLDLISSPESPEGSGSSEDQPADLNPAPQATCGVQSQGYARSREAETPSAEPEAPSV